MKERNQKKRYNNNKKREEKQEQQFVVTPEIAEDIDNILGEAVSKIKAKYPGSEEAMDTFLSALAQAMTDIIGNQTEDAVAAKKNYDTMVELQEGHLIERSDDEAPSYCEPVLPDYDKAIDKMRDIVRDRNDEESYDRDKKDKKKKDKDLIDDDLRKFLNEDEEDEDEIRVRTYGKVKNAGSACSSWYNVYYTLEDDTPKCMKLRANDLEDAEAKALKKIGDDCSIDYIDEIDDDEEEYEDEVPVGRPDDDDDWDDDDENYSLARAAFHSKRRHY